MIGIFKLAEIDSKFAMIHLRKRCQDVKLSQKIEKSMKNK